MGLFNRKKTSVETRQFFPLISETWGTSVFPAEKNAAVDRAVSLISGTISTLPLTLYVHTKSGLQEAWAHNIAKLLKDPAVEETSTLFWKTIIRHLLLTGNAFIFKHKYEGEIVSLEIVDPSLVFIQRSESGRKLFNIGASKKGVYTEEDIIHIPYLDDGYGGTMGMSPVQVHKREILTNDVIAEYINIFFERGIGSRLLVELDKDDYKVGAAKTEKLVQEFSQYFNKFVLGRENFKRPIITPPSSKISLLETGNNEHTKVLELYDQSCATIYRLFNVPPEIINSKDSKYNSLSQKQTDFWSVCIHPLCRHISETLEKGLLKPEEKSRFVIKYDYSGLLEADVKEKTELLIKKLHAGVMTLSEVRAALNMSQYDDETANNTLMMPNNLSPFNKDTIDAAMARSKLALQELNEGKESKSEAGKVNKSNEKQEEIDLFHNNGKLDKDM